MADKLDLCGTCGGKVASSAANCPHCGAKRKEKTSTLTWILTGLLALAFFISLTTSNEPNEARACPPIDPNTIKLMGEYAEAQADFSAKAERLRATGLCVMEGDFGKSHNKFYFAIDKDGNPKNRYFIRLTREELKR